MKKGFTLIEVMVVIVILGILAAVGSPKLFGAIAKAKASEVPVAAGGYTKLQDAFLAEKTSVGNWQSIGYIAPGNGKTNNFCYSQGSITSNATAIGDMNESLIGWGASNLASLNDCGAHAWWSILLTPSGSVVSYSHNISYAPCAALTSGWNMGTTLTGDCENANQIGTNKDGSDEGNDGTNDSGNGNESSNNGNGNSGPQCNANGNCNHDKNNGSGNNNGSHNGWNQGVGNPHGSN